MMRQENELRVTLRRGYVHMQAVVPLKIFTAAPFFFVASRKDLGSEAKVGHNSRNLVRHVLRISHSCIPLRR